MQGDNPISWLMFFTLVATTFIIAGSFIYFLDLEPIEKSLPKPWKATARASARHRMVPVRS